MSMRPGTLALAAALVLFAAAHPVHARRVTLTRAAIAEADATRLSDLVARVAGWSAQTTDFYTWTPTPDAAAIPRTNAWTVTLNGQVLDVSVFDANHLELVPVSLAEIDSIVIDTAPEIGTGWDASRGRIAIHTSRAPRGWRAGGAVSAGNETGDPGPYRYTPRSSPNVDAIGPDASAFVSVGRASWYAALSGGMMQQPFTDDAIRERTTTALGSLEPGASLSEGSSLTSWFYDPRWPSVLRTSAALRAGVRAGGTWHDALFSIADARRYFHYSEPFGSEVPTDQRLVVGSVSGAVAAGANTRAGYRAGIQEKTLEDRDDALTFDYDWATTRYGADADLTHDFAGARVRLAAGVERREADSADSLSRDADTFTRAGATVANRGRSPLSASAGLAGTFAGDEQALAANGALRWVIRDADTLSVRAAYDERLFAEDDNLWLWSERGYALLESQGRSYTIDGTIERTAVSSADVRWSSSGVFGAIDLALGVRRFDDAYIEERTFAFEPASCSFTAPTRVVTGQTGHTGLVDLRLWHRLGDHSRADFSFAYVEEFSSDDAFSRAWQSVPRHRLSYGMTFHPRASWTLRGRVTHYSATAWTDYRSIDGVVGQTDGVNVVYRANVDGATFFDLFVQHAFWGRSAFVDLIARNLFDADVRYHPAGASMEFTVFVQLRLLRGARP